MAENNPYANDNGGFDEFNEPERTSALAVTSLVMSLLCCIPGLGLIGSALGVVAMLGIGRSRGRVGGKGMAMAGIIIGVLMTVAWVSFAFMGMKFANQLTKGIYGATGQFMTKVEQQDFDGARVEIFGTITSVTDEQMDAFRTAYQAEYGSFHHIPTDFFKEVIPAYAEITSGMQPYQGRQDVIPIPAIFDTGTVLLIAKVDQNPKNAQPSGTGLIQIPMTDIWIVMPDGSELQLIGTSPVVRQAKPADPEEDSDEEAEDDEP